VGIYASTFVETRAGDDDLAWMPAFSGMTLRVISCRRTHALAPLHF
jgi:hypothetical protein